MNFKQCKLSLGNSHVVAWIPEKGAVKGYIVEIPELDGYYTVDEVFNFTMSREEIREKQRMNRNSLPSILT